jgi:hypothetical protein
MNVRLLIVISFFSALVADVLYYLSAAMQLSAASTYIEAAMKTISLVCLLIFNWKYNWGKKIPAWVALFFKWMIVWNIICLVKGAFTAENYWDWKYLFLNAIFTMTIPYAIIAGVLFVYAEDLFSIIVTKLFVFGFLIIPLTLSIDFQRELFPRAIVITISFFILIIPYVKPKWRIAILCVAVTAVLLAYDFRSNVMRIVFALFLVGVYYARNIVPAGMLKTMCVLFFIIPFIFLFLGITGKFDVFKPTDDIDKYAISYENGEHDSNLAVDTRTFLYQEVLASMQTNNSFLFGEGAIGKYKTQYFEESVDHTGRYGSEVGILNMLLYSGLVGIFLHVLVLFSAVYYGVCYSNNYLCKMIGVFLAFRWIMFFIEDYPEFDMNYFFIWVAIGLCLSKDFRAMTDAEIRQFFSFPAKERLALKAALEKTA